MIPNIKWDKIEPLVSADGTPLIRYAVSDHDGVRLEMSMHDETIRGLVPDPMWFAAMSFPTNNGKIDPVSGGGFIALLKVGKPNDKAGNLLLIKATTTSKFSATRYATAVSILMSTVSACGIHFNKHVMDTIRGN